MRLFYILLCFLTLVGLVNGMPPISRSYNTHCHCPRVESRIIPPDSLRSIKLIPKGAHCQATEIIAGLASGEKICLNPQSAWVRKLVRFVMGRRQQQQQRQGGALL